jgi:opacity protein-like surface antigen
MPAFRRFVVGLLMAFGSGALAAPALAQGAPARSFGAGPRISFVRGSADLDSPSARYSGGQLRARLSEKTALEVSLDYRAQVNESLTERVRDYPVQGSLLLYPVRSALSVYLLGGAGWYSQRVDSLVNDLVVESQTTRTMGYHAGLGGEIMIASRVGVHLDYRYTMIRFGDPEAASQPGALPIPGLTEVQRRLKLSHQGSMWTSGLTVYF